MTAEPRRARNGRSAWNKELRWHDAMPNGIVRGLRLREGEMTVRPSLSKKMPSTGRRPSHVAQRLVGGFQQ